MKQIVNEGRYAGRFAFRDNGMMTFDAVAAARAAGVRMQDGGGGLALNYGNNTRGGVRTHDGRTVDSTGAFLVGELERLDQTLHGPLAEVSYGRDIDMREDVTLADEVTSFTLSTYGSQGGLGAGNGIGNGKAWFGKVTNQVAGVGLDISKITNPLTLWGVELKYTIPELESAAKLGRPIDSQKFEGMNLKHEMDVDEQVYYGDTNIAATGLINHSLVSNVTNVANGASGFPTWVSKTPDEILSDINTALVSVWTASVYAVMPNRILLPPADFAYLSTQKVSLAGNVSILKYILENNIAMTSQGKKLEIYPLKWLVGAGAGGTIGTSNGKDRMVVYSKAYNRVRYPMTMLQRTPVQYDSLYHKTTYFCRLGNTEVVYPETIGYFDGLS